jgi:hypothetical protein
MYRIYANNSGGKGTYGEGYSAAFGISCNQDGACTTFVIIPSQPFMINLTLDKISMSNDTVHGRISVYARDNMGNSVPDGVPIYFTMEPLSRGTFNCSLNGMNILKDGKTAVDFECRPGAMEQDNVFKLTAILHDFSDANASIIVRQPPLLAPADSSPEEPEAAATPLHTSISAFSILAGAAIVAYRTKK